ncbi:unnamed protein product [Cylindrotheca closterium]|uniref:Uncharacterized protein n=1 Tax=Cylindrotheca closterium TaxID=2856 RepID=A0AAD2PY95_9STRA|nr:unnamed protein product [Cylindrotheca closterium]
MLQQHWTSEATLIPITGDDLNNSNSRTSNRRHQAQHAAGALASRLGLDSSFLQQCSTSNLSSAAFGIASQVGSRVGDAIELIHPHQKRGGRVVVANDDSMILETSNTSPVRWKQYIPFDTDRFAVGRVSVSDYDEDSTSSTSNDQQCGILVVTGFCKELHELPV